MVTDLGYWSSDEANLSDERFSDMRRIISISQNTEVNIHDEDAPEDAKTTCRYIMKQSKGLQFFKLKEWNRNLSFR